MHIRHEVPSDINAIMNIQYAAFKGHPMHKPGAEPTEHRIVEILRAQQALSLSLVAVENTEDKKNLRGHIAFSPATIGGASGWYLLGPVGVMPTHQGKGIGSALIRAGLQQLQEAGAAGVVLVGNPGYYTRFGFTNMAGLTYPGVPEQYVLATRFTEVSPKGEIAPHAAFAAAGEA